jgi:hypothetical protein
MMCSTVSSNGWLSLHLLSVSVCNIFVTWHSVLNAWSCAVISLCFSSQISLQQPQECVFFTNKLSNHTSIIIIIFLNLFLLITFRWQSFGKARSQQQIKVIYPSTSQMMCAVLIIVIFCSSVADGWTGIMWRFWSNPFLIVPHAPGITGTILILPFHILLTSISKPFCLLSFSVSFVLMFESSGMATLIRRQVFSFLSCSSTSGQLLLLLLLCT